MNARCALARCGSPASNLSMIWGIGSRPTLRPASGVRPRPRGIGRCAGASAVSHVTRFLRRIFWSRPL